MRADRQRLNFELGSYSSHLEQLGCQLTLYFKQILFKDRHNLSLDVKRAVSWSLRNLSHRSSCLQYHVALFGQPLSPNREGGQGFLTDKQVKNRLSNHLGIIVFVTDRRDGTFSEETGNKTGLSNHLGLIVIATDR